MSNEPAPMPSAVTRHLASVPEPDEETEAGPPVEPEPEPEPDLPAAVLSPTGEGHRRRFGVSSHITAMILATVGHAAVSFTVTVMNPPTSVTVSVTVGSVLVSGLIIVASVMNRSQLEG